MLDNQDLNMPSFEDDNSKTNATAEYLKRASAACDAGDSRLGMHLYLAAFEEASISSDIVSEDALRGLKQAWAIACKFKERSLAEHIFEKMEPYLSQAELAACVAQLQSLALDRLQEFGVSREDLEGMAQAISQELMGVGDEMGFSMGAVPKIVRVEHVSMDRPVSLPAGVMPGGPIDAASIMPEGFIDSSGAIDASSLDFPSFDELASSLEQADAAESIEAAASAGEGEALSCACGHASSRDEACSCDGAHGEACAEDAVCEAKPCASDAPGAPDTASAVASTSLSSAPPANQLAAGASDAPSSDSAADFFAKVAQGMGVKLVGEEKPLTYDNLAGFDSTIAIMRDLGIGLQDDPDFKQLLGQLNARHGLSAPPPYDAFLFRAPAREDANRFMLATIGELGKPALRMHMEENLQGQPMLCVTAQTDAPLRPGTLRNAFANGGTLVLENVDLWMPPQMEENENLAAQFVQALSRGAREAIGLIRAAVDNPDVIVLVSSSTSGQIDGFFLDMLEPLCVIDIDNPTPEERVDIWMDIAREHPSIRGVNRADLVRLSANLPRFDMYMAAREAIEEAYKYGLVTRHYRPVTRDNIFDKIAAYQPLDSGEYHSLEEEVIRDFRRGFDDLEDALFRNGH